MKARFATGPSGEVNLSLRDLIAQLPLNLRFNLSKETNMGGSRPLVPYLTSIRPQKNGEILMEVGRAKISTLFRPLISMINQLLLEIIINNNYFYYYNDNFF